MIAAGVLVINRFRPILLVFSLILVVSAVKMLGPEGEEEDLSKVNAPPPACRYWIHVSI